MLLLTALKPKTGVDGGATGFVGNEAIGVSSRPLHAVKPRAPKLATASAPTPERRKSRRLKPAAKTSRRWLLVLGLLSVSSGSIKGLLMLVGGPCMPDFCSCDW